MVERSLSSFPKFLSEGIGNLVSPGSQNKGLVSSVGKGFEAFIQSVNRYRTKYEGEQIIQKELSLLQQKICSSDVTQVQMRDYLCCAIYCSVLGYDVSFACIHAVKLAQQGTMMEKRTGYLAASLLLHPGHELVLLLVNTIQKDLKSSNILDNCMALSAACQMIGSELIPALLPLVLEKLKHSRELVRQKAVMCLYRFQLLAPDLLAHVQPELEKTLFDKDPCVMAAAVNIICNSIQQAPAKHQHLVTALISILQQLMSRKMSAMFEYCNVSFPWLQTQILRNLGNIAAVSEETAEKFSPILLEFLQRATATGVFSFAVIYECLMCVSTMKPNKELMAEAPKHVGCFLRSSDTNLQYVGVKALIGLVKVVPSIAMDYQSLIVDSLEKSDKTIQRKMHKLLYQIANPANVDVICEKLLQQLEISLDKYWRSELIVMVMDLSKRFEPSVTWPYDRKLRCLQCGADTVTTAQVESVISDFSAGLATNDLELKQFLVKKCIAHLMLEGTQSSVIQVASWTLAELSALLKKMPEDRVLSLYTRHLCNPDLPDHVKAFLISGLQKLVCNRAISNETMITGLLECLNVKQSMLIKQRMTILLQLCKLGANLRLDRDPEQFDFTLSFLDSYLCHCLEQGASPYKPRHLRLSTKAIDVTPQVSLAASVGVRTGGTGSGTAYSSSLHKSGSSTSSGIIKDESESKLDLSGVKRIWGKQGIIQEAEESKTLRQDEEVSRGTEQKSQKQQLADALFGGVQPMGNRAEFTETVTHHIASFGASDQDSDILLPSSDTAGWRNIHKVQTEKLDGATKPGQTLLEISNDDRAKEDSGYRNEVLSPENDSSHDFTSGFDSKIKYEECLNSQDILAENLEMTENLNVSPVSYEESFIHDTAFSGDLQTGAAKTEVADGAFGSETVPRYDLSIQNTSGETVTDSSSEKSGHNDLDEALSMLLNDSSSFVNISVVGSDQDSSNRDVKETENNVKVRETIYNLKEENISAEAKDGQDADTGVIEGSLYDDDIDI